MSKFILAGFLFLSSGAGFPFSMDNSHKNIYDIEDHTWDGECQSGQMQSPIDIIRATTIEDFNKLFIKENLDLSGYNDLALRVANKGLTVDFDTPNTTAILKGGPLSREYVFDSFHFHTPSEHSLDYVKYPLEFHFVHRRIDMTLEQALEEPDGLAVIGRFVDITSDSTAGAALSPLIPYLEQVSEIGEMTETGNINVRDLLGTNINSYYTYHGSLTTPYCQEVVTWILLEEPLRITDLQYTAFRRVVLDSPVNFRTVQAINNRRVYRTIGTSSAMQRTPNPLTILILALATRSLTCLANVMTLFGYVVKEIFSESTRKRIGRLL